jgi:predicted Zn-dependent protease with MMP-like domain
MRNVVVTVEPGPLGFYQGILLASRTLDYAGVLPDRITVCPQATCAILTTAGSANCASKSLTRS